LRSLFGNGERAHARLYAADPGHAPKIDACKTSDHLAVT